MKKDYRSPIKKLREKIGVSQRQLADALGVHHSYIANLENNLINIEEEDEADKSKVIDIFEIIAEWSGEDSEKLIQEQKKITSDSVEIIKENVKKQISDFVERVVGTPYLAENEVQYFIDIGIRDKLLTERISPIAVIREESGITQRQLAQAAEVSQAYIARVERGELALSGPNTGLKLINYIIEALGVVDLDSPSYEELFELILKLQDEFMELNKFRAQAKVRAAFEKIKKEKEDKKQK